MAVKTRRPRREINFNLKASTEVETAMSHFKPRFGNENDLRIINSYGEIKKLLTLASEDGERYVKMREITRSQKKREEEIKQKERGLLWQIEHRG